MTGRYPRQDAKELRQGERAPNVCMGAGVRHKLQRAISSRNSQPAHSPTQMGAPEDPRTWPDLKSPAATTKNHHLNVI